MSTQPNIVFVLTDDQGYPPLGCHGHPFIETPCLDRFHDESVRFTQFHSGTTCAPTRAGLMTGHYCNSTGVWHTIGGRSLLRGDEWSLPQALRENGYTTGLFGKWHLGDEYPLRPQDRGFDRVVCHGGGGISQQPDFWGNDYFDDTYRVDGEYKKFEGYCTDVFFAEGLKFIGENRDNPFFCFISSNAPHGPLNVPDRYADIYRDKTDEHYARFLGMISNIDENFGCLRDKLREWQLEENTILIFMSDNGQALLPGAYNGDLRGGKGSPYDGGHRIPFFLRWSGGGYDTAKDVDELTAYIDFMPTLLDLCGITPPTERIFHGVSLLPLLCGNSGIDERERWRQRCVTTDTQRVAHPIKWLRSCVMQNKWRLVNRHQLYDIEADPSQQNDIAADHPQLVEELRREYERWWELCADHFDEDIASVVGDEESGPIVLRTHDLRNELDHSVTWNQSGIRAGESCAGYWPLQVKSDGVYRFTLRRWPQEAEREIRAGIDGDDIIWNRRETEPGVENLYSGGVALNIDSACLAVEGYPRLSADVNEEDNAVSFDLQLRAGLCRVRSYFIALDGALLTAAYYVDVEKRA